MILLKKFFRASVWGNSMYIDTHCHLNSDELKNHIEEILTKCQHNNVDTLLVVGWDIESSKTAIALAKQYPNIFAIVGIHPSDVEHSSLQELEELIANDKVVGIGEIGLDYHWEKDEQKRLQQQEYFIKQIDLANKVKKPICIHSRDAIQDTYNILKEHYPKYGCVMHCFSGSQEMMECFLKLGCYISFGGPVTFKNAKASKECAMRVPLNRLLLETDCPYLTPHPYRGQINDPSFLPLIGQCIASIREVDEDVIAEATTNNAKRIYRL